MNQLADSNSADVNQTGTDNVSNVDQDLRNTATVDQSGERNDSDVNQLGGQFESRDNVATVTQSGDDNIATVNQDNGVTSPGIGVENEATIEQSGDWNVATVSQDDFNTAEVLQTGLGTALDPNTVDITQNDDNDTAYAEQNGGEGNVITINQDLACVIGGCGSTNNATAIQTGSFNTTTITQD